MNRNAAEKGNGAVRDSTTWALDMCSDLRKRDAEFGLKFQLQRNTPKLPTLSGFSQHSSAVGKVSK
ncbi:hypothetical protein [Arthrobacter sp. TS-15]|uniref:hypothetical protein n=1 Tax=Arthrobacter sp. TS-15 TaxID=2510797 RepID=UPI001EE789D1|nr:hypothetical protein [Arthrobacter sp. TS-15]